MSSNGQASTKAHPRPDWDIARAKQYHRVRRYWALGETALSLAGLSWFALSKRSLRLRRALERRLPDERLVTPGYLASTAALSSLASLPLDAVRDLGIERAFGLTKQSAGSWLADRLKALALNLAIGVPLGTGAMAVVRRRPSDWWLILASATVPITIVFSRLAPVLILPLFNKFERLDDPEILARIERLAERAGLEIAAVYRMDMSRQTEKPNAFFTGLGKSKRIVLGDTLLDRFPPDEVEGVVAHEAAHQIRGDLWRLIALGSVLGYGAAYLVNRLAPEAIRRTSPYTGVDSIGDVAAVPVVALVSSGVGWLLAPIGAAASRAIERRADRLALALTGKGNAYASALRRLAGLSLADPHPPAFVRLFAATHPPIMERIAEAEKYAAVSANT